MTLLTPAFATNSPPAAAPDTSIVSGIPAPASPTRAHTQAAANYTANLIALQQTQPALAQSLDPAPPADFTWTFARDGSLSARDADDKWWAGCSLPTLAARALLQSLDDNGHPSCYLAPDYAALLTAARAKMGLLPVLYVAIPQLLTLRIILACHDFSSDITAHRLWFLAGEDWAAQLQSLFDSRPGLVPPTRFIKTRLTKEDVIEPMIAAAQTAFSTVAAARAAALDSLRAETSDTPAPQNTLLIAGSSYQLWNDAAYALRDTLTGNTSLHIFDCDDPLSASPLALAVAARDCRAILAANVSRSDAPGLTHPAARWITWQTIPQVPLFDPTHPQDGLILTDPTWKAQAISFHWPADRLRVAAWPGENTTAPSRASLVIIANTRPIQIPPAIEDMSSHRVLWELIEQELQTTPLIIDRLDRYLDDRCARVGIQPESLDRHAFYERLIIPAFQQNLALLLLRAELPLKIFGTGWDHLEQITPALAGPVTNREEFNRAIAVASVLIYAWPVRHAHPIDSHHKPVLARASASSSEFIRRAKMLLATPTTAPPGSPETLRRAIADLLQ